MPGAAGAQLSRSHPRSPATCASSWLPSGIAVTPHLGLCPRAWWPLAAMSASSGRWACASRRPPGTQAGILIHPGQQLKFGHVVPAVLRREGGPDHRACAPHPGSVGWYPGRFGHPHGESPTAQSSPGHFGWARCCTVLPTTQGSGANQMASIRPVSSGSRAAGSRAAASLCQPPTRHQCGTLSWQLGIPLPSRLQ